MRTSLALAGAAAVAAGLGAGHLVASLTDRRLSPVAVVGAVVIDAAPLSLKEWAIATFGTWDKAVLLVIVTAVTLGLGALVGLLGRRQLAGGLAAGAVLAAVPWSLAATRYGAGAHLVGAGTLLAGATAWTYLRRQALRLAPAGSARTGRPRTDSATTSTDAAPATSMTDPSRRRFLAQAGAVAGGAGALALAGTAAPDPAPAVTRTIPAAAQPLPPLPEGLPGITPFQTPTEKLFRIDIALTVPRVRADDWTLQVTGMVDAPYTIGYDELLAMPMVEHDITLACVSNEVGGDLVGGARWRGVPVAELLRRAHPHTGADMLLSRGPDGFSASTPLSALLDGRTALVAVAMNGEPLTPVHGFPARLVTPGLYGFVGATKWLRELRVTRFDRERAYWTTRGWSAYGPVKLASRIDTPTGKKQLAPGQTVVGGVAWAGQGVSAVELQVDEGPWQPTTLGPQAGDDYWAQWMYVWDATPGQHRLRVRAVGKDGTTQTADRRPVAPDGATGHHEVQVWVA
ncbi:MAG: molybdopterin-dependent oxidoreductase [Actinomycetia bacterium]|nr:molybdopterin-dependent oxidoreductase [Actinomycetes bacterium]